MYLRGADANAAEAEKWLKKAVEGGVTSAREMLSLVRNFSKERRENRKGRISIASCFVCGKKDTEVEGHRLKKCSLCKNEQYCSRECQVRQHC